LRNERISKIASKIRQLRKTRGWTQAELARRIGVTTDTTSQYEKNGFPRFQNLKKLAQVFEVPIEFFYSSKKGEHHPLPMDSPAKFKKHFLSSSKKDRKKIIQFILSYTSKTNMGRP